MLKKFFYGSFSLLLTVGIAIPNNVNALDNNLIDAEISPPINTVCKPIDYTNDTNRSAPDNRTIFKGDKASDGEYHLYGMCLGTYPNYPSTSIEEGNQPFYYAKYRFIPDPMPIYEVYTSNTSKNGYKIDGIEQTFTIMPEYEEKDKPTDEKLFIYYPYDNNHEAINAGNGMKPNMSIKPGIEEIDNGDTSNNAAALLGPYQVGANSYYHNTYRGRFFATEVTFNFDVLEPRKGQTYMSSVEGKVYNDVAPVFSGEIYYELDESCYSEAYLDYSPECREVEFYFPKGKVVTGSDGKQNHWEGEMDNGTSADEMSKNVIPVNRLPYKNPGTHTLVFTASENTQMRLQKDLGAEFQTIGNPNNKQGANSSNSSNGAVYFPRKDINNGGTNPYITGNMTTTGKDILTVDSKGHYVYDSEANTDFINYCDTDTDSFGNENYDGRTNSTGTDANPRDQQKDNICYHNEGPNNLYWIWHWSDAFWYSENPLKRKT